MTKATERELLQELVNLMDTSIEPDLMEILRLAQNAEAYLLSEEKPLSVEVPVHELNVMFTHLEQIVNPFVEYNSDQLVMCNEVIQDNKETAQLLLSKIAILLP